MRQLGFIGAALVLVTCSGQSSHKLPAPSDDAKTAFIRDIRATSPSSAGIPDPPLIGLGQSICEDYRAGDSTDDIIKQLATASSNRLPVDLGSALIVSATSDLCQQYEAKARRDLGI